MMENEDNEGKVHSSGYNVDELRLLFSCMKREPPGRMDRAGRFIAVIASKFVRHKPRKKSPQPSLSGTKALSLFSANLQRLHSNSHPIDAL
jgi:hypothetical protein